MLRSEKIKVVDDLKEMFSGHTSAAIAHYHGLNMSQITELRNRLREAGIRFMIAKNSLAKIAVNDNKFSELDEHLTGPTAIAVSNDPVALAKILSQFVEENEQLKLIGAIVDGQWLNVNGIKTLSKMPSLDELRAKIIALLVTPATSIASILVAPATKVARVVSAYSEKN